MKFAKTSAVRFTVNSKGVQANECRTILYLNETDSIFHPGLNLRYDTKKMELIRQLRSKN